MLQREAKIAAAPDEAQAIKMLPFIGAVVCRGAAGVGQ